MFRDNAGKLAELVDAEVKSLIEAALEVAVEVISSNKCVALQPCLCLLHAAGLNAYEGGKHPKASRIPHLRMRHSLQENSRGAQC